MAKKYIKISLATKFRLVFGVAVLGIIAAALVVPWYFTERLADWGVQRSASEPMRLRFNEWLKEHPKDVNASSRVAELYTYSRELEGRKGPAFVRVHQESADSTDRVQRRAMRYFQRNSDETHWISREETLADQEVYRCFQAVRVSSSCAEGPCHGSSASAAKQFDAGQLVGMIDLTMPADTASAPLIWGSRVAFLVGGFLAAFLALVLFAIITQRLILRPVRHLRNVADNVTDGDWSVRSTIRTGDELQRLGESFNEMLEAITQQHEKLRAANQALDLKLSKLAEANVTLFQANKVKNEFLANVSHELRTPLNSIIGFADLLMASPDERVQRYGRNITTSAKNLLSMINDLLDIAKIEAGRAEAQLARVSVLDVCQTLLALMGPLAQKKDIDFRGELPDDLPIVRTDASKLQQILYNLLSNAIKYTPAGGQVVLSAKAVTTRRKGQGVEEVCVAVADTGPGIAESDQEHIFEKFYQLDRSLTRESSGTGLGLAIARELTNLLGGRLGLQSSAGHGATFSVCIPVAGPECEQAPGRSGKHSEQAPQGDPADIR